MTAKLSQEFGQGFFYPSIFLFLALSIIKHFPIMKTPYILFLLLLPAFLFSQNLKGPEEDIEQILANIQSFSKHLMAGESEKIVQAYTSDGKIFPNNTRILEGPEALRQYWTPSGSSQTVYHKVLPEEITVEGDKAYDYGYYEGKTRREDGSEVSWQGKYVIVWKKVEGEWKIYLDIWNRVEVRE